MLFRIITPGKKKTMNDLLYIDNIFTLIVHTNVYIYNFFKHFDLGTDVFIFLSFLTNI